MATTSPFILEKLVVLDNILCSNIVCPHTERERHTHTYTHTHTLSLLITRIARGSLFETTTCTEPGCKSKPSYSDSPRPTLRCPRDWLMSYLSLLPPPLWDQTWGRWTLWRDWAGIWPRRRWQCTSLGEWTLAHRRHTGAPLMPPIEVSCAVLDCPGNFGISTWDDVHTN